ncbi:PucR family transcriptional regulator [Trujillonella humicola]|uniref:PucR family transcriptional regulator n=1 Tax=Trujillonella humicola TaxID=3383699 RepID=UPI00390627DA
MSPTDRSTPAPDGPTERARRLADLVRGLHADPTTTIAPDGPPRVWAATEAVGPGAVAWAWNRAHETATAVLVANPDQPDLPRREITDAAMGMLLGVLHDLADSAAPEAGLPALATIARDAVARGLPFDRVVREMRRGQAQWTEALLTAFSDAAPPDVLSAVALVVARHVDTAVDSLIAGWLQEREQQLSGAAARRRRLVELLLEGSPVDARECRSVLGLDVEHVHLALVLRAPAPQGTTVAQDSATRVARLTGAATTFVHQATDDTVWLWASHPRRLDSTRLDELRPVLDAAGQRLALGLPRRGPRGFRDSHLDARAADRLPQPAAGGSALVRYGDADLAVLLAADMDQARRFVRDHLGPLAGAGTGFDDLRRTLAAYLRGNASLLAAANALHVHRNTVVYRLRRVEQLLGHPVSERAEEVLAAFTLVEHFGTLVLEVDPDVGGR